MGIDLWVKSKHKIAFKGKEIEDKSNMIDLLNSLKLEESEFLKEMADLWFSKCFDKEAAKKRLEIKSWYFDSLYNTNCDYFFETQRYYLEGPYGLISIDFNKYFFSIDIALWRYFDWFNPNRFYNRLSREKWRLIFYKIIQVLGGEYAIYFPDNMTDLDIYIPSNYYFPIEMEEYFKTEIKNLDHVIQLVSDRYSKPLSLAEADMMFNSIEIFPLVVDRFEDLDKTIVI